jgi:hypothetical protein
MLIRRGNLLLKLSYEEQRGYPTFGNVIELAYGRFAAELGEKDVSPSATTPTPPIESGATPIPGGRT